MKKKWITAILIYISLVIICLIIVYAVPSVRGLLEKTYITEYGSIDVSDKVGAYIVRDETVYTAGQDSKIERTTPEFMLVKASRHLINLTPSETGDTEQPEDEADEELRIGHKYVSAMKLIGDSAISTAKGYNKVSGYVCYYIDGAEESLSTSHLSDLTLKDYKELTRYRQVETPDKRCRKGEPVFKIISNRKWYLVFYMDGDQSSRYYPGRTVTVRVGDEDLNAKVASVDEEGKKTRITLVCKFFNEELFRERTLETTVTVASAEGLVLNDSSIIEVGGRKGVLVKNKLGEHKFKPISIKADNGEKCVAFADLYVDEGGNFVETIGTYDEIVADPSPEEVEELNSKQ